MVDALPESDITDAMSLRPVLRDDLLVKPGAGDEPVTLRDPISRQVHHLSELSAVIARRLDGKRTLAQVRVEAERVLDVELEDEDILTFVSKLERALLLDTASVGEHLARLTELFAAEDRARWGQMSSGALPGPLPPEMISVREDLRFECRSCGACCRERYFVALVGRDEERLRALDLEGELGLSVDEVVISQYVPGEPSLDVPVRFLRQRNGRCVFLEENNLCAIHRRFGPEHKPLACRSFPYEPVLTPRGGVIRYRPECSSQHLSSATGPTVASRKDEVWVDLTGEQRTYLMVPERVTLRTGEDTIGYDTYLELEAGWLSTARAAGWRAAWERIGADLGVPRLESGKPLQRLLGEAVDVMLTLRSEGCMWLPQLRELGGQYPAGESDEILMTTLLLSVGVARPMDPERLMNAYQRVSGAKERLPSDDGHSRLLTEYLLSTIAGKYLFNGISIAAGIGLIGLLLLCARFSAAYTASVLDRPLDARTVNDSMVGWHLLFFNTHRVRLHLMTTWLDDLEAVAGMPESVF